MGGMLVDLYFKIAHYAGEGIPADHGYALFAAMSRALETRSDKWLHSNLQVGLHTIRGARVAAHKIMPRDSAQFGFRLPQELVSKAIRLAGQKINIDGQDLHLGTSQTHALVPAARLYARLVTTKNGDDPQRFDKEIARQMAALDIQGKATRIPHSSGNPKHDPTRRIFRVKDKKVVAYSLLVEELTAEESIRLQEQGLGGRRRMGCGVFTPFRPKQ